MRAAIVTIAVCAVLVAGCGKAGSGSGASVVPTGPSAVDQTASAAATAMDTAEVVVPFHAEMVWNKNMISPPADRCTRSLPGGTSYLWLSEITATMTATHLGTGAYESALCVFGTLIDPLAPPGRNGVPSGWYVLQDVWTAANGDRLISTGELTGFTAPPGTPGFKFIQSLQFMDGGTGRFAYAHGEGQGLVDGPGRTAVFDATLRYGKQAK